MHARELANGGDDRDGKEDGTGDVPSKLVSFEFVVCSRFRPVLDDVQQIVFCQTNFERISFRPGCCCRIE